LSGLPTITRPDTPTTSNSTIIFNGSQASSSLSKGTIAGIIIGGIMAITLACLAIFFYGRYMRQKRSKKTTVFAAETTYEKKLSPEVDEKYPGSQMTEMSAGTLPFEMPANSISRPSI
jgi:hypothetical protein